MADILSIIEEISTLNAAIIEIIRENQSLSSTVVRQSETTVSAVNRVSNDIHNVVAETKHLSSVSKSVENELSEIE